MDALVLRDGRVMHHWELIPMAFWEATHGKARPSGIIGKICPLTIWENRLREKAGQTRSDRSFIGRVVHALLMCDLDERTLRRIRLIFAAIVTVTFFIVWPRF